MIDMSEHGIAGHTGTEGPPGEPQQQKQKKKKVRVKKPDPLAEFSKRIIGKLVTFFCSQTSGTETVEGVPMKIFADPDGRHIVELFSSDGAETYIYLDQVATFVVRPDMEEELEEEEYYEDYPEPRRHPGTDTRMPPQGQPVDEVYYSAGRRGPVIGGVPLKQPRGTERVE